MKEPKSLPVDLTICGQTWCGVIERHTYTASGLAALIHISEGGDSEQTLTFNPHQTIQVGPNECVIKNHTEGEGILEQLIEKGIVRDTGRKVPSGWIVGSIVEIIAPALRDTITIGFCECGSAGVLKDGLCRPCRPEDKLVLGPDDREEARANG